MYRETETRPARAAVLAALLCAPSCASYEPEPLDPRALLAELIAAREPRDTDATLRYTDAVEAMRRRNARIVAARAAARAAGAVADVATPLANPSISAGPLLLDGASITSGTRWGVEAALGWLVPWSGKRGLRDALDRAVASAATNEHGAIELEERLALRRDWVALVFTARTVERQAELRAAAEAAVAYLERRMAAGGSAIDLKIAELDLSAARADELSRREDLHRARGDVARRIGMPDAALDGAGATALPPLPDDLPDVANLRERLLQAPPLLRLRARYEVAERALELEVARQYPDLALGLEYEREERVDRWGLPIGIDLPVFDRNQKGIANAAAQRQAIRETYVANLREQLTAVESARELVALRAARWQLVDRELRPRASALQELVRRTLEAGRIDPLRLLDAAQRERRARLESLMAHSDLYDAWLALEQACGAELIELETREDGR